MPTMAASSILGECIKRRRALHHYIWHSRLISRRRPSMMPCLTNGSPSLLCRPKCPRVRPGACRRFQNSARSSVFAQSLVRKRLRKRRTVSLKSVPAERSDPATCMRRRLGEHAAVPWRCSDALSGFPCSQGGPAAIPRLRLPVAVEAWR